MFFKYNQIKKNCLFLRFYHLNDMLFIKLHRSNFCYIGVAEQKVYVMIAQAIYNCGYSDEMLHFVPSNVGIQNMETHLQEVIV